MSMREQVEEILKIEIAEKRIWKLEELEDRLTHHASFELEDMEKASAYLLERAYIEKNEHMKSIMFSLLATCVSEYQIDMHIDWDRLRAHFPSLPEDAVIFALEMVGWSKKRAYIPFLERYLYASNIKFQMTALDAIAQIWWDMSNKELELKKKMKCEEIASLWYLINNPGKHSIAISQIQQQFLPVRADFLKELKNWLDTEGHHADG